MRTMAKQKKKIEQYLLRMKEAKGAAEATHDAQSRATLIALATSYELMAASIEATLETRSGWQNITCAKR